MNTTVETEEKVGKRQVAKHALLAQGGAVVEDWEQAHGIRYIDLETNGTFDYTPANPDAMRMLALFGARTLATNEASAARNGKGLDGAGQLAAIKERFDGIDGGVWSSGERAAIVYDPTITATAATNLLIATGKKSESDRGDVFAKFSQLIAEKGIDAMVTVFRGYEGFDQEYRKLKGGKAKKDAGDLGALLG